MLVANALSDLQPWTKYFRQTLVLLLNSAVILWYWQSFHFGSEAGC